MEPETTKNDGNDFEKPENLTQSEPAIIPVETQDGTTKVIPQESPQKEEAKPKKKRKIFIVWKILIPVTIIFSGIILYLALTTDIIPIFQEKEELVESPIVVVPEPVNPVNIFESDQYKFSFEYNKDLHNFTQGGAFSEQPTYFLIASNQNEPKEIEKEDELLEGYLVKISVFENIDRNVADLAGRKIEKFKLECPSQKEIGVVYEGIIDGLKTASFEVENCNQDYVINFVAFEGYIFEIEQAYRGDIGFKQNYKTQTEEILKTIKWSRALQEKLATKSVTNSLFLVNFDHPWLNETCCDVTKPSIEGLTKISVLADSNDVENPISPDKITDKLGVYAVPRSEKGFELFLNEQKQTLIQEYKVVEGKNPVNLSEANVSVGNKDGVKLVNYAWWGTVIFVDHPSADAFLVFIIPNGITEEFQIIVDTILESVKFLENSAN